jgi:hypothetical protein
MELRHRSGTTVFFELVIAAVCVFIAIGHASAEQRYTIEDKPEWSTGKYIQQHALDVGDVPGHKVRVLELQYIYNAQSQFAVSGVKVKEIWVRGYSDYTNGKGRSWGYQVWLMDDGSKLFVEHSGTTLADPTATGSIRGSYHGVARFTGGTGKFSRIRGTLSEMNDFDNDPKTGYNRAENKGEYWFEE